MGPMGAKELFEVFLKLGDRIGDYWKVFHIMNVGVFGWLLMVRKELPLQRMGKLIVSLGLALYVSLTITIILAIRRTYELMTAVASEMDALGEFRSALLDKWLDKLGLGELSTYSTFGIGAAALIVIAIVLIAMIRGIGNHKKECSDDKEEGESDSTVSTLSQETGHKDDNQGEI